MGHYVFFQMHSFLVCDGGLRLSVSRLACLLSGLFLSLSHVLSKLFCYACMLYVSFLHQAVRKEKRNFQ